MEFKILNDQIPHFETRRDNCLLWFKERSSEKLLRFIDQSEAEEQELESTQVQSTEEAENGFVFRCPEFDDFSFTAGSVRILGPELSPAQLGQPIYILVLGEWTENWTWLVPFSSYSHPATEMELLSREKAEPLQTLQVWNARTCPNTLLKSSWYVNEVASELVDEVKRLYRSMVSGDMLEEASLLSRLGTKVLKQDDPRREYLEEETQKLNALTDCAVAFEQDSIESGGAEPNNIITIPFGSQELRLVASKGAGERELAFHIYHYADTNIRVVVAELEKSPRHFTITVHGDQHGLFEKSTVFNGAGEAISEILNQSAGSSEQPLQLVRQQAIQFSIKLADGSFADLSLQDTNS